MIGPFEVSQQVSLGLAVIFGLFFGLSLERGGLGNPHKLTGVFYLRDFSVPKVMFTGIVVAVIGLYLLIDLNLIDMSKFWIVPTFFWPQIVGGALFGVGFVVSGYCPGTAVVGLASGRLDALVTIIGVGAGSLLFAVLFPVLEEFYVSSDMGAATLPKLAGVNHWVIILPVIAFAVGMFLLMEWYEKKQDKARA
ncbi:MAG: YeeE/YedE family protein [Nitrospirae bacterium]|nr:YeeE/YedE family protein [Nitrospirota bacterium]